MYEYAIVERAFKIKIMYKQTTNSILMVRPAHFGFNGETANNNVFQQEMDLSQNEIQQTAQSEFDEMVHLLRAKEIDIIVIEDTDTPIKPDAIFPNNWFCSLPIGELFIFPMFASVRRAERRADIIDQLQSDFKVSNLTDLSNFESEDKFLESTGSIIFDHIHKLAFACESPRTNAEVFQLFCNKIGYQSLLFHATDENDVPIYHTNVMLNIGTNYAVICLDSIKNQNEKKNIIDVFIRSNKAIIDITANQVRQFAGNMLQVHNRHQKLFTICSRTAFESLSASQKMEIENSSTLLPVNIPLIEKIGGGSARCMMAELFFDKK